MGTGRATPRLKDDRHGCHGPGYSLWHFRRGRAGSAPDFVGMVEQSGAACRVAAESSGALRTRRNRTGTHRCRNSARCDRPDRGHPWTSICPSCHHRRVCLAIGLRCCQRFRNAGGGWNDILGNVMLSPVLFSTQRRRMPAILAHELSHAHLQSWISQLAYLRLPNWFKEGLAVMVSEGGGAEGVSDLQARDAIRRGDRIDIEPSGSLLNLSAVRFENLEIPGSSFRTQLAYRQAGLFVAFLHDSNPAGFERMMDAIFASRPFAEALTTAYATDLPTLWSGFAGAR